MLAFKNDEKLTSKVIGILVAPTPVEKKFFLSLCHLRVTVQWY